MDTENETAAVPPVHVPRKPRSSEIAAKVKKKAVRAKPKTKPKAKSKKATKPKSKTKPKKKTAPKRKPVAKKRPKVKAAAKQPAGVVRGERLELRLSKREKAKLLTRAKATRRTVTSVVVELIERMK